MELISKIISGGQTGVDRAAFDVAIENGIEFGGFVPKGRRAEDGPIPATYTGLIETETRSYAERTQLNVRQADATLILSRDTLSGGSLMTRKLAEQLGKPCLHIDLSDSSVEHSAKLTLEWLAANRCKELNIAGPRASTDPEIYVRAKQFLAALLESVPLVIRRSKRKSETRF